MNIASPLRYPGGKSSMADLLSQIRKINQIGNLSIAEPFAGGAGASLKLLYLEDTPDIHINDKDRSIYNFWWSLLNQNNEFLNMMSKKRISMAEYFRQREIYNMPNSSKLENGFATFYLNRCNRSGIILNGGPIGGHKQTGNWKLNARFNKEGLIQRCIKVSEYSDRINLSNEDGIDFIKNLKSKQPFYFIDPPYFSKGPLLYLNLLSNDYHTELSLTLKEMTGTPWVLTYDDCPEIRKLYKGWTKIRPFSLTYSAANKRKGKELLITPKGMSLPKTQKSEAIVW